MFNIDDKVRFIMYPDKDYTGYIREIIYNRELNKIQYYCIEIIDDSFTGHDGGRFLLANENTTSHNKICIQKSSIPNRPGHMYYVDSDEVVLVNSDTTCTRNDTLI